MPARAQGHAMSENNPNHVFARSGLAALSDLATPECQALFRRLEAVQEQFLAKESQFRSPDYQWTRDPLHDWSRSWEYPYVFYHLERLRRQWSEEARPRVVDVGSGVTFFPFAVAGLGYEVGCTDIDPVAERDMNRAVAVVPQAPGSTGFRRTDGQSLPFADAEADVVYCVSVLEHIPTLDQTVAEIARVLKPGGHLLLTIDLDLRGDAEIGIEPYRKLRQVLRRYFEYEVPVMTVHPADLLTTLTGPYNAFHPPEGWRRDFILARQAVLRRLIGRKPRPLVPYLITVEGFALVRRAES